MRNALITLLFFLNSILNAQIGEFAPIGATWYYSSRTFVNNVSQFSPDYYFKLVSVKDTTYLGFSCKKIEGSRHRNTGDILHYEPKYIHQSGDTIFEIFSDGFKSILMNFDAPVGNTQPYNWKFKSNDMPMPVDDCIGRGYVLLKDTIILSGTTLKTIDIKNLFDPIDYPNECSRIGFTTLEIIEKIGSRAFLFPIPVELADTLQRPFSIRCYSDNTFSYQFGTWACDSLTLNMDEHLVNLDIKLFPNPTNDKITIDIGKLKFATIDILDMTGRKIISQKSTAILTNIGLTDLPNGVYLCKTTSSDEVIRIKKFIINH